MFRAKEIYINYGDGPDDEPRIPVTVIFLDRNRAPFTGVLDDTFYGKSKEMFEISDRGIRTSFRWRDVDRVEVLRP